MSFLTRNLKQSVTVWKQDSTKDTYGSLNYSAPRILKGRWEDKTDLKIDLEGREVMSQAVVFLKEDVQVGDYLFLGVDTTSSPTGVKNAFEVRAFRKTPTINGRQFERMAVL